MGRKKRVNKLFTLDTETIGLEGDIKRIAIYDGERIEYGYSFRDVIWVMEKAYKEGFMPHCYIHNLEFDIRKGMEVVFEKGNVVWHNTKVLNGRYAVIACKQYIFHDSFRLLPMSLAKLSKSFDLKHGKMDLWKAVQEAYPAQYKNVVDFFERCDKDDPIYMEYLGYDVISLYELIEKFMEVSKLSFDELVQCLSTASISKRIFKNGYGGVPFKSEGNTKTDFEILCTCKSWKSTKPIKDSDSKTPVSYHDIEEKIREAYYGGRTEVFVPHAKPYHGEIVAFHYDVNSLYPAQYHLPYPVGYPSFSDHPNSIKLEFERWMKLHHGLGFIKAKVYVPTQYVPPLPVFKGKLVFMCGYLEGTWTYNELEYAIKNCGVQVVEYMEQVHFKQTYPVFKNFGALFSPMKEKAKERGEKALETFAKLVQNTGYGYTGMNRDKTELQEIEKIEKYEDRLVYKDTELGYIEIESNVLSQSIQVQVAAYVTSYARLVLLDRAREQAEKGNIYYCDTDSLVTDTPLNPEYVHHSKLGYWDLEAKILEAAFIQPKVYSERTTESVNIKFKGVTRDKQAELQFTDYIDLLERYKRGEKGRLLIEEDKKMLRSILFSQKNNRDANLAEIRSKHLNIGAKQKRDIDYLNNISKPWYCATMEEFYAFNFKDDLRAYRLPDGSLVDVNL